MINLRFGYPRRWEWICYQHPRINLFRFLTYECFSCILKPFSGIPLRIGDIYNLAVCYYLALSYVLSILSIKEWFRYVHWSTFMVQSKMKINLYLINLYNAVIVLNCCSTHSQYKSKTSGIVFGFRFNLLYLLKYKGL